MTTAENQKLEASFSTLVISIASSAVMNLGLEKNPMTNKIDKNMDLARFNIDLLVLLQEKTKGNLTDTEKNYLEAIVQDLRLKFIQAQ